MATLKRTMQRTPGYGDIRARLTVLLLDIAGGYFTLVESGEGSSLNTYATLARGPYRATLTVTVQKFLPAEPRVYVQFESAEMSAASDDASNYVGFVAAITTKAMALQNTAIDLVNRAVMGVK